MAAPSDATEVLRGARSILLVDWPSRDVPDTLARAGLTVTSADGPGLYNSYEADGAGILVRRLEGPPAQVDLVYSYRPIAELPDIVAQARDLEARAVWLEGIAPAEASRAREIVESAGLRCLLEPHIADAARAAN